MNKSNIMRKILQNATFLLLFTLGFIGFLLLISESDSWDVLIMTKVIGGLLIYGSYQVGKILFNNTL